MDLLCAFLAILACIDVSLLTVMLGMTPPRSSMLSSNPPDSPENTSPGATGKDKSTDLSPTLVLLDIDLDAPVVNMPKTSDGTDFIAIDFGHIEVDG